MNENMSVNIGRWSFFRERPEVDPLVVLSLNDEERAHFESLDSEISQQVYLAVLCEHDHETATQAAQNYWVQETSTFHIGGRITWTDQGNDD